MPQEAYGPVLVLGATGTVGRDVVREVAARGVEVRAALRDPSRAPDAGPLVRAVRLDLDDASTWAPATMGCRGLFLLRPPQVRDVDQVLPRFVDAALAAGVQRVAFLSVQGADRVRVLPHHALERHLQGSGADWTLLRAANFFQNLLTVHRGDIRDRDEVFVPAGRGRHAGVDTRDVAEVAALALTEPGHARRAYELTAREALDYGAVARILTEVLGRPIRYPAPSLPRYWVGQRRRGMPWGLVAVTSVLYTTARLGLAASTSDQLERVLGRAPRDLRRFAEDHAAAWQPR